MFNEEKRLLPECVKLINEFFPGTQKSWELFDIAQESIVKTEYRMIHVMKKLIQSGDYKDMEKVVAAFEEVEAANWLLEQYKDSFPLKSVLERKPTRVLRFFKRITDIGAEEFRREMGKACDVVYGMKSKEVSI